MTTRSRTAPAKAAVRKAAPDSDRTHLRKLLDAMSALRDGDFSARLPSDWLGIEGKLADRYNEIAQSNQRMAAELERIGQAVGKQGRTRQRASAGERGGSWKQMESSINTLIDDLLWPTERMTDAIAAVAKGDLSQTIPLDVDGRPLEPEWHRLDHRVAGLVGRDHRLDLLVLRHGPMLAIIAPATTPRWARTRERTASRSARAGALLDVRRRAWTHAQHLARHRRTHPG